MAERNGREKHRKKERKKKEQESAEAISGLKITQNFLKSYIILKMNN